MPSKKVDPTVFSPPEVEEFNNLEQEIATLKDTANSDHEDRITQLEANHKSLIELIDRFGIRSGC